MKCFSSMYVILVWRLSIYKYMLFNYNYTHFNYTI